MPQSLVGECASKSRLKCFLGGIAILAPHFLETSDKICRMCKNDFGISVPSPDNDGKK